MIPWKEIDRASVPGQGDRLILKQRGTEFSIRTAETELMNSRIHGSEEALASLALERTGLRPGLRILVGGLGMGYTLAAVLANAGPDSAVHVVELIPEVILWNQDHLGHLAGDPLKDQRVRVRTGDVGSVIREKAGAWDVILLDVDNGPAGLTRKSNSRLYSEAGLVSLRTALRPGGVAAVWSAAADDGFTRRMGRTGFDVKAVPVRARSCGKGSRHTIWTARKKPRPAGSEA